MTGQRRTTPATIHAALARQGVRRGDGEPDGTRSREQQPHPRRDGRAPTTDGQDRYAANHRQQPDNGAQPAHTWAESDVRLRDVHDSP